MTINHTPPTQLTAPETDTALVSGTKEIGRRVAAQAQVDKRKENVAAISNLTSPHMRMRIDSSRKLLKRHQMSH